MFTSTLSSPDVRNRLGWLCRRRIRREGTHPKRCEVSPTGLSNSREVTNSDGKNRQRNMCGYHTHTLMSHFFFFSSVEKWAKVPSGSHQSKRSPSSLFWQPLPFLSSPPSRRSPGRGEPRQLLRRRGPGGCVAERRRVPALWPRSPGLRRRRAQVQPRSRGGQRGHVHHRGKSGRSKDRKEIRGNLHKHKKSQAMVQKMANKCQRS